MFYTRKICDSDLLHPSNPMDGGRLLWPASSHLDNICRYFGWVWQIVFEKEIQITIWRWASPGGSSAGPPPPPPRWRGRRGGRCWPTWPSAPSDDDPGSLLHLPQPPNWWQALWTAKEGITSLYKVFSRTKRGMYDDARLSNYCAEISKTKIKKKDFHLSKWRHMVCPFPSSSLRTQIENIKMEKYWNF